MAIYPLVNADLFTNKWQTTNGSSGADAFGVALFRSEKRFKKLTKEEFFLLKVILLGAFLFIFAQRITFAYLL